MSEPTKDQSDDREPSPERQAELRAAYQANKEARRAPYAGVRIHTLGEITWITAQHGWSGQEDKYEVKYALIPAGRQVERADFQEAWLAQINLVGVRLRRANLRGANLVRANLASGDFVDADMSNADLGFADFSNANLTCLSFNRRAAPSSAFRRAALHPRHRYHGHGRAAHSKRLESWVGRGGQGQVLGQRDAACPRR